ncbi:siphovirus ReqiPepy6 Gp37-like family protein [Chengkuizengella sp. SCS-71B]|uniref:siphovirus ReqiPepy6 Gp37-like family protein n=1 Tax=Chengkuizengella sp. SCS-71B TaxID=3115290 RepID=UPI0032C24068
MELYVFNKQFEMIGIIDSFISLIWTRNYYKAGTVELHVNLPQTDDEAIRTLQLLQKGNLLVKSDSSEEAAYIDSILLEDDELEKGIVQGFFIDQLIGQRIVWGTQNKSGSVEEVMKYYVSQNCIEPENVNRVIPNLVLSQNRSIETHANESVSYKNLAEFMETLANKHDVGWRILFDITNKQYIFDVFDGFNRTDEQFENPRAIFALEYENILNQTYSDSVRNYKNMALVAGEGEGSDRKIYSMNDDMTGFDRVEHYVDARDLQSEIDGQVLSNSEYQELLKERGLSKLAELQSIKTFEAGISLYSNLVYKQDFGLGDLVTIKNKRWGIQLNTRITSIEEVYENDVVDIRVNFGNNIPTLIDNIKSRMG